MHTKSGKHVGQDPGAQDYRDLTAVNPKQWQHATEAGGPLINTFVVSHDESASIVANALWSYFWGFFVICIF